MNWITRRAIDRDVEAIKNLISDESRSSTVILRKEIDVNNFVVAECDGEIIGCVGYKIWDQILPELTSTIVKSRYRGQRIGTALVQLLLEILKLREFTGVFCLTGIPKFFMQFGFAQIPVGVFPAKILSDCQFCPRNLGSPTNPKCDDVAMYLDLALLLTDVPLR